MQQTTVLITTETLTQGVSGLSAMLSQVCHKNILNFKEHSFQKVYETRNLTN
jgi:hypothetical protein